LFELKKNFCAVSGRCGFANRLTILEIRLGNSVILSARRYLRCKQTTASRQSDRASQYGALTAINQSGQQMNARPEVTGRKRRDRKAINIAEAAHKKALSIGEFCALHSMSRPTFYKLEKEGRGPKVIWIGTHKHVTAEAAAEWRQQMERDAQAK
jgi:predicted DNA-binding transcriptional regulator AlpA